MNTNGPDSRLQPSAIVGDYRLIRPLGEGGMGSVWLAEHVVLPKRFAIKFLLRDYASDSDVRARFEQEARTIGGLDHPNVVSAVNYGFTSEGQPYLVMEALTGKSLGELLEDALKQSGKPLPAARAIDLVRQACAGVAHAHAHGVIHRDLKPDNLFAARTSTGAEQVKVLDFGIAKIRDATGSNWHKTQTGAVLGTPYYMSPEQARGESDIDYVTDIYSLTAILYELLSGKKPHDGNQYNALIADIIERDPTPLDEQALNLPPGLSAVLVKGMARSRSQRYQSVAELDRALATFGNWPLERVSTQRVERIAPQTSTTAVPVSVNNAHRASNRPPATAKVLPALNGDSLAPSTKGHAHGRSSRTLMIAGTLLAGIGALVWMNSGRHPNAAGTSVGAGVHTSPSAVLVSPLRQNSVPIALTPSAAQTAFLATPLSASGEVGSVAVIPIATEPAPTQPDVEPEKPLARVTPKVTSTAQTPAESARPKAAPHSSRRANAAANVQLALPRNPYSGTRSTSR